VGRDRELGILRSRLTAARDGDGSLVLIGGEAGIGKTALCEAVCREATQQGALVLVGRCYDLTETPPYGPWIDLFSHYQPTDDLPPPPVPFAERGTVGAVASQAMLFHAVLDFLTVLATERPLVILLEDAHWQDQVSLDLLRFLAREITAYRILFLLTYCSDELTRRQPLYPLLPLLVREAAATRIMVRPLETSDTRALVQSRFPLPQADSARLVAYLEQRGEGNPFFIGELLQTLVEERVLRQEGDRWALHELVDAQVPPLLRQVIDGRLARLGEDAQRVLAIGAVIGQNVPFAVWGAVTGEDEARLLAVVEQATEAHLVAATADGVGFHFVHALIREALHASILPLRRRIFHRQIGDVLATTPTADPDAVAYHFQHANDVRALPWLVRAGERAQAAYAWATAAHHFEAALALTPVEDPAARGWLLVSIAHLRRHAGDRRILAFLEEAAALAEQAGDRLLAAWALFACGFVHSVVGNGILAMQDTEAGAMALVALTPRERARYPPGRPWIPVEPHEVPVGSVILLAALYGRFAHALTLAREWMGPYQSDEGVVEARWRDGWGGLAIAHAAQGRPAEAHAAYQRAQRGARALGHYFYLGATLHNLLVDVVLPYETERTVERGELTRAALDALVLGREVVDYDASWVTVPERFVCGAWDDAAFLGERGQHRLHLMTMQGYVGQWHRARGKPDAAWGCVRWGLPEGTGTALGDAPYTATPLALLAANLALDAGDLSTAREWLDVHRGWLAWSGGVRGRSEEEAVWARYHRQAGAAAAAVAHAELALAHATEPRQPLALVAAHRLLGELQSEAGRYGESEQHLKQSLVLADDCAAPYERALTLLALAELHVAAHRPAEARPRLNEASAIFISLGAQPVLVRADALAARLDSARTASPGYPAGLSAREAEVLRLVAEGLSNPQIGERLFLSPRTVEHHLHAIFNKTGVSSRAAAARWATENALA
jgi:DNA-binding CsgD family transcriptional regulator